MDLDEAISKRRSIRHFQDKPIEKEKLKQIILAGISAPSACNMQDWRFVILTDKEKDKLVKIGGADTIKNAPTVVLVTYLKTGYNYRDDIQSAAACIENMLLKATSLGIGGCWICHLPLKSRVRRIFSIPNYYEVIACVLLGYPKYEPLPIKRKESYNDLFVFKKRKFNFRNFCKNIYIKQPFRPQIIENKFTKRWEN